ncbi:MAG: type II toxin-antitoxin system RelE/ParE family toxin [Bacteroidales bacterium]|nr:type II toxin-antitoxin system RelE/ParE family toxin [Bacteroidales bacterium]
MAKKADVVFLPKAVNNVEEIALYIAKKGFPITAAKFVIELYDFGDSIKTFPLKYPYCIHKKFRFKKFRCAVYKNNYMFIYKVLENRIVIFNVIHVKTLG